MDLSPAQEFLAHNCVARVRHTVRTLAAMGVRPHDITLPLEEIECLAIAASPVLGIDPTQFDTGERHDEDGAPVADRDRDRAPLDDVRPEWHFPT